MQEATNIKIQTVFATHNLHATFAVHSGGDYTISTITLEDTQYPTDRGVDVGRHFTKPDNLKKIKPARMREIESAIEDYIGFNGLSQSGYGFSGMGGI